MSQIPGPQNSCILDRELLNLPRHHYVDKLLRLTNSSEPDITSYRDVLYRRAKQLPTCPDAKLITRRGSRKTPAYVKLAHDCYILNSFLKGDPSEIETIFTKTKTQVVMNDNEIDLPEDKKSGIDLTTEQRNKYAALQDEVKTDREKLHKISEELHLVKNENHALKQEMKNLTAKTYNSLIQHEERINTINDTNINMLKTYVSRIDSANEAVQVQNCKAKDATNALSETQSLSYAEVEQNGTKIVESNFISKPKVAPEKETNQQNRHEQQDMSELNIQSKNSQNDSSKYEATPNGDCANNINIPMADTRTIQQNTMYFDREKSRWVRQQRSEQGKSQQTNIQDADEYYPEENTNKIETIITSKRQSTTNVNTYPRESSSFKFKGKYHGQKINQTHISEYQAKLCINLQKRNTIHVDEMYEAIVKAIVLSSYQCLQQSKFNRHAKPYWTPEVKKSYSLQREARRVWVLEGQPRGWHNESYAKYKRCKQNFVTTQKIAIENVEKYFNSQLIEAAECDSRLFWSLIKSRKNKRPSACTHLFYKKHLC
ncbi:hypothetical protein MAR_029221 [Mya arenaria]|uniref:Uncharacterized protein n=1 Tax=Mya arenaria TaxID=6604 RepID=A0ABY7DIU1_MYAAR|nr:hypothetical protein MAR_029221 [Mya arenaria]